MATNIKLASIKATGTTTARDFATRFGEVLNVKDFGAVGDGSADDGPEIQACFDEAFGTAGSPHGNASRHLNKAVFFPKGQYKVGAQLFLNNVRGAHIYGAGSNQTRLFYTGADTNLPDADGITSLITTRDMRYSEFSGITFDANGTDCAFRLHNLTGVEGDGTGVSYRDVVFTGAVGALNAAFLVGYHDDVSSALGSEQLFINCGFTNSPWGLRVAGSNALDYVLIGCYFEDCEYGINCEIGNINSLIGCRFKNNSVVDVYTKQRNALYIEGGRSESVNFAACGPAYINGVYHANAVEGSFWSSSDLPIDEDNVTIDGCRSTNGVITGGGKIYLRGNTFDNANVLTGYSGTVSENI
jgi:hypothetical protein